MDAGGEMSQRVAASDDRATSGIKVPPPLYYLAGFGAGLLLEAAFPIDGPPAVVTIVVAVLGVGLFLYLDGLATARFRSAGTSPLPMRPSTALVTSGPYRFTRNPMYVGMAALYAAVAVATGVIWALIALPVVLVAIDRLVIAKEEPYLEARFGEAYRDYRRRVRRWV
jgi:protein-S-isoprenylcysteine O-methyltransferase Ste14